MQVPDEGSQVSPGSQLTPTQLPMQPSASVQCWFCGQTTPMQRGTHVPELALQTFGEVHETPTHDGSTHSPLALSHAVPGWLAQPRFAARQRHGGTHTPAWHSRPAAHWMNSQGSTQEPSWQI